MKITMVFYTSMKCLLFVFCSVCCISAPNFLFKCSQRHVQVVSGCILHSNSLQCRYTLRKNFQPDIAQDELFDAYYENIHMYVIYLKFLKKLLHRANWKFWFLFPKHGKLEISLFFPDDHETWNKHEPNNSLHQRFWKTSPIR